MLKLYVKKQDYHIIYVIHPTKRVPLKWILILIVRNLTFFLLMTKRSYVWLLTFRNNDSNIHFISLRAQWLKYGFHLTWFNFIQAWWVPLRILKGSKQNMKKNKPTKKHSLIGKIMLQEWQWQTWSLSTNTARTPSAKSLLSKVLSAMRYSVFITPSN